MVLGERARLEKNARIAARGKETRRRHKDMQCVTRILKLDESHFTPEQKYAMSRVFLEAKWYRNWVLDSHLYPTRITTKVCEIEVVHKAGRNRFEGRAEPLLYLGSQVKQGIVSDINNAIHGLAELKKKGHKVGRVGFAKRVNAITFTQYGITWRLIDKDYATPRIRLQGLPGTFRLEGARQFCEFVEPEYTVLKLLRRTSGYYVAVTLYEDKAAYYAREGIRVALKGLDGERTPCVGIDMGVRTQFTLSGDTTFDERVPESERHKQSQKRMSRRNRNSKRYHKARHASALEYEHEANKKDDLARKFVRYLTDHYEAIYIQDEKPSTWRRKGSQANGAHAVQYGILGRVYTRLKTMPDRVFVCSRWMPTTAWCPRCGRRTPTGLDRRIWKCAYCGLTDKRDPHAAGNMKPLYMAKIGEQDLRQPRDVPIGPYSDRRS